MGFQGGANGKELLANVADIGDPGLITGFGRSPGGGHGNSLRYSCLENPTDRGAWQTVAHGVPKKIQLGVHSQILYKRVEFFFF